MGETGWIFVVDLNDRGEDEEDQRQQVGMHCYHPSEFGTAQSCLLRRQPVQVLMDRIIRGACMREESVFQLC